MDKQPQTLLEAIAYFADPEVAHRHFCAIRWPHGIACPRMGCGSADIRQLGTRQRFRCADCKRDFTAKVGTIFEDSPLSLSKWLPAIWLLANAKNGISSMELHRALGVTQKTAWFMLHRIRVAFGLRPDYPLQGVIEVDETFVGGMLEFKKLHERNRDNRWVRHNKTAVFGMLERGHSKNVSKVRAMVVPDTTVKTLWPHLFANVDYDSVVTTDAAMYYSHLDEEFYRHDIINHAVQYVNGNVYTNGIENFWTLLKRAVKGTYVRPSAHHLDGYVSEQVFRFNERDLNDGGRFRKGAKMVDGKRLTYRELIAKNPTRVRRLKAR